MRENARGWSAFIASKNARKDLQIKDRPKSASDAPSEMPSLPVNPKMSFFDEEYVMGRRVPSPPIQDAMDETKADRHAAVNMRLVRAADEKADVD